MIFSVLRRDKICFLFYFILFLANYVFKWHLFIHGCVHIGALVCGVKCVCVWWGQRRGAGWRSGVCPLCKHGKGDRYGGERERERRASSGPIYPLPTNRSSLLLQPENTRLTRADCKVITDLGCANYWNFLMIKQKLPFMWYTLFSDVLQGHIFLYKICEYILLFEYKEFYCSISIASLIESVCAIQNWSLCWSLSLKKKTKNWKLQML